MAAKCSRWTSRHLACAGLVGLALAGAEIRAQQPEPRVPGLEFEVASVKPAGTPPSPGRLPPGQWRAYALTLAGLIGRAYPQFTAPQLVLGGPAWVRETPYDIEARMEPATTPAQVEQMIAKLLADRFELRFHKEQRPIDVYILSMSRPDGRLGPQLKRADPACVEARIANAPLPAQCQLIPGSTEPKGLQFRTLQISNLTRSLSFLGLDRPILDQTGLEGYFDLQLAYDYAPSPIAGAGSGSIPEGVSLFTALREQAGLKLEAVRQMMDVIVIDSAKVPAPN
jgi:uncharacterized protein (TIGR03435 family)